MSIITQYPNWDAPDACLVRMSELNAGSCILTLDSDFQIYRKNNNQVIDLITIL